VISSIAYMIGNRAGWFADSAMILDDQWSFLVRNVFITLIVTALALRYFYVTYEWRHNVELQALARVHALQARIRPHFLFNSMNTIAALTRSNPARAEEAVQDLADLFPRQPQRETQPDLPGRRDRRGAHLPAHGATAPRRPPGGRMENRRIAERRAGAGPHAAAAAGKRDLSRRRAAARGWHGHGYRRIQQGHDHHVVRNPVPRPTSRCARQPPGARQHQGALDLMYGERATVKAGRFDDEYIVTLRFPFRP
jgi:hypothetical protein